MAGIKKVNKRAVSNAAKVHKFMFASEDFSLATGELTPTMKVKRHKTIPQHRHMQDSQTYCNSMDTFIIKNNPGWGHAS